MSEPTRIRATATAEGVEVRVLMKHVMETGLRKDDGGRVVPAHFINQVSVTHMGKTVFSAQFGPAVAKNPYLQFKFKGGLKGEEIVVKWIDNQAESRTDKTVIS